MTPDGPVVAISSAALSSGPLLIAGPGVTARELPIPIRSRVWFDQTGKRAAGGGDSSVEVWDLRNQTSRRLEKLKSPISALAFHPVQSDLVALGCSDGSVVFWDMKTDMTQTIKAHSGRVQALAFSSKGDRLVSGGGDDRTVQVQSASGERIAGPYKFEQPVFDVSISPDGQRVAADVFSSSPTLQILGIWTLGQEPAIQIRMPRSITSLSFHDGGALVAAADNTGTVHIYDAASGKEHKEVRTRLSLRFGLAVSAGDRYVAASTDPVTLWEGAKQVTGSRQQAEQNTVFSARRTSSVAFHPNASRLATAGSDGKVTLWDVPSGALFLPPLEHGESAYDLAFSPDGNKLATSGAGRVKIWPLNGGEPLTLETGLDGDVVVAFDTSTGSLIAAAGPGESWAVWDVSLGKPRRAVAPKGEGTIHAIRFTTDSKGVLTVGSDGTAKFWDWQAGKVQRVYRHAVGAGDVWDVAVHPDGAQFATAGADRTVKLWKLDSDTPVLTISQFSQPVRRVSFSADGKSILALAEDGVLRTDPISSVEVMATVKALSKRPITVEECRQYTTIRGTCPPK